jgi:ribosomal protein S18 acetylase RimI-like enzyme
VTLPEPILSFWVASLELGPRVRHTPWGTIVTDPRYPRVYEANHASVLTPSPDLSLHDVRAELHPALSEAGASHEHIEFMDAADDNPAMRELLASSGEHDPHVLMVYEGERPLGAARASSNEPTGIRVVEVEQPDGSFWEHYRSVPNEYGEVLADDVLDQMLARVQEILGPAERFFVGSVDGAIAGIVSVLRLEGVACVDNVVTVSAFRGRGVATAMVTQAVSASLRDGAKAVFLLAEEKSAAQRLYRRLGFRVRRRCYSFTRPFLRGSTTR